MDSGQQKIVFFDGDCNLCNGSVDFLMRKDQKRKLKFASLQGETAKNFLSGEDIKNLGSVLFFSNGKLYKKSTAALKIGKELGGLYKFLSKIFSLVPNFIRDAVYSLIAKNRYKLFGKRDSCRTPSQEERDVFLP